MLRHGPYWLVVVLCLAICGSAVAADQPLSRREQARLEREQRAAEARAAAAAQAEAERQAQPSQVPGLTVGVFEAQPPFTLPLPDIFDDLTSAEDVLRHALMVAQEEADMGLLADISPEQRARYIAWRWQPVLEARQQRIRDTRQQREQRAAWQVEQAVTSTRWRQQQQEAERAHELRRMRTRHERLVPVLTDEQRAELDFLVEDMRRRQR